jgi:hypothetical protein
MLPSLSVDGVGEGARVTGSSGCTAGLGAVTTGNV